MPAVLAFHYPLGRRQGLFIDAGPGQQRQQQVEDLALIARRRLDDKRRIGVAGKSVPLAAERLHAFFQAAFAAVVDAAEQQMFEQVRQLLVGTIEIIQAHAHHQSNRHMPAFRAGLEYELHAVGQRVAFNLESIRGERRQGTEQKQGEQQTTHSGASWRLMKIHGAGLASSRAGSLPP